MTIRTRLLRGIHARTILRDVGVDWREDYHVLTSSQVDALLTLADDVKYRKPRNYPGSRARAFHARLQRRARPFSWEGWGNGLGELQREFDSLGEVQS